MQGRVAKRVLILVIVMLSISLLVGCAGKAKRADRFGYLYYPSALVKADQALDEARAAGKDKECPAEYNAAKDMVDRAYEIYMACRDQEAIDMAQDAIAKAKALCPPKPMAETRPEPKAERAAEPRQEPKPVAVAVAEPTMIILEDIHFDFDKATLTREAKTILAKNVTTLKDNQGIRVQIEGHACAHGSEAHNMALSERRANAVREYLVREGIASDRLTTIAYGEARLAMPELPTAKNKQSKEAKANRRVHFQVIVK